MIALPALRSGFLPVKICLSYLQLEGSRSLTPLINVDYRRQHSNELNDVDTTCD